MNVREFYNALFWLLYVVIVVAFFMILAYHYLESTSVYARGRRT